MQQQLDPASSAARIERKTTQRCIDGVTERSRSVKHAKLTDSVAADDYILFCHHRATLAPPSSSGSNFTSSRSRILAARRHSLVYNIASDNTDRRL